MAVQIKPLGICRNCKKRDRLSRRDHCMACQLRLGKKKQMEKKQNLALQAAGGE